MKSLIKFKEFYMRKEIRKKNFAIISGILYMATHKENKGN